MQLKKLPKTVSHFVLVIELTWVGTGCRSAREYGSNVAWGGVLIDSVGDGGRSWNEAELAPCVSVW